MIYVERPDEVPAHVLDALNRPLRCGRTERQAAEAHYSSVPPKDASYPFKKYKAFEVCQELDRLFHRKCAYCETGYEASQAGNVEHFRPKGGIEEAQDHPGYWWLAASWPNLLPSCIGCNQRRKQVCYEQGMTLEDIERASRSRPRLTYGKGNHFPVLGDNWVTQVDGDLTPEEPLLINPCVRQPEAHMEWVFDKQPGAEVWEVGKVVAFLRPTQGNHGPDKHGAASIAIYGLNRVGLFRDRAAKLLELQKHTSPVVATFIKLARMADPNGAGAQDLRRELIGYRNNLFESEQPEQKYSSMAAAYIREVEAGLARLASPAPPRRRLAPRRRR